MKTYMIGAAIAVGAFLLIKHARKTHAANTITATAKTAGSDYGQTTTLWDVLTGDAAHVNRNAQPATVDLYAMGANSATGAP